MITPDGRVATRKELLILLWIAYRIHKHLSAAGIRQHSNDQNVPNMASQQLQMPLQCTAYLCLCEMRAAAPPAD